MRSSARLWTIFDIDGQPLHSGTARTRKALVEQLVREGRSFARADFTKYDLSRLDLSGIQAPGARFAETNIAGTKFHRIPADAGGNPRDVDLTAAEFTRVEGQGASFRSANMDKAKFTSSDFHGCTLIQCSMVRAEASESDFCKAHLNSSNFYMARLWKSKFQNADLTNVDWAWSEVLECDFVDARMGHRALGSSSKEASPMEAHLHNRTRGASVLGGLYNEKTQFSSTVPAFISDSKLGKLTRKGLFLGAVFGLTAGIDKIFEAGSQLLDMYALGMGTAVLAVVSIGGILVKEKVSEFAKDKFEGATTSGISKLRRWYGEAGKYVRSRLDLVGVIGKSQSLGPIRLALRAKSGEAKAHGYFSGFRTLVSGLGRMVVCDRRHLALAMSYLSNLHLAGHLPPRDVLLVRYDTRPNGLPGPRAVAITKDGIVRIAWSSPGGLCDTTYDETGALVRCTGPDGRVVTRPEEVGLPAEAASRLEAVSLYEAAILSDTGLGSFDYPRGTHRILRGMDDSMLVQNMHQGRIDNPVENAPALLRPDNTGRRVREGRLREEWLPQPAGAPA